MASSNNFEEAVIGKLELELKQMEEIHGYEKSQYNIIKKNLENKLTQKDLEINRLREANKNLNDRLSAVLYELNKFIINKSNVISKTIATQTGDKDSSSTGVYVPREDEKFLFHEPKKFLFGSNSFEGGDIYIRVENKFENQFLLLNYIFVSKNNKMELSILLKNRKTPNYRIKVKFLKNAILRQRRGFVPSKINIMGLTSFEAPIAVKVVHP